MILFVLTVGSKHIRTYCSSSIGAAIFLSSPWIIYNVFFLAWDPHVCVSRLVKRWSNIRNNTTCLKGNQARRENSFTLDKGWQFFWSRVHHTSVFKETGAREPSVSTGEREETTGRADGDTPRLQLSQFLTLIHHPKQKHHQPPRLSWSHTQQASAWKTRWGWDRWCRWGGWRSATCIINTTRTSTCDWDENNWLDSSHYIYWVFRPTIHTSCVRGSRKSQMMSRSMPHVIQQHELTSLAIPMWARGCARLLFCHSL